MYIICVLGLIQFIVCFFTMIDIFPFSLDGYTQRLPGGRIMRIHSILNEAGNLGTCLTPIIAYILFDKKFFKANKGKSIIIIITHLLTFATVSYVLLALLLFVKMYMKVRSLKYILIAATITIIPFFINSLNASVDSIEKDSHNSGFFSMMRQKIIETSIFFELKDPQAFEALNASSYATLTNLWVAANAPCRLTGTGLGTHQENYRELYSNEKYPFYGLNSEDGYSLFVRILSEFGILGIILYYIFVIKNFNFKNIVNFSIFFLLIALWIRGGHYTFYGTVFFHLIYYYTSKKRDSTQFNES